MYGRRQQQQGGGAWFRLEDMVRTHVVVFSYTKFTLLFHKRGGEYEGKLENYYLLD